MHTQQDGWQAFVSHLGPNHPLVKSRVENTRRYHGRGKGYGPGLGVGPDPYYPGNIPAPGCIAAEKLSEGYWPNPWSDMPPGGLPFDRVRSIQTPAALGIETVVLDLQVPYGFDGVILGIGNQFTGPGFVEGSGNLIWRIRIGLPNLQGDPQLNYEDIRVTYGTATSLRDVYGGIVIQSNQFVEYTVTHGVGSPIIPAGTRINCAVAGYYWPRGTSPANY